MSRTRGVGSACGEGRRLPPQSAGHSELGEDARPMIADGLVADEERLSNVRVGVSLNDKAQHLHLATRQVAACHWVSRLDTEVDPMVVAAVIEAATACSDDRSRAAHWMEANDSFPICTRIVCSQSVAAVRT